jgi:hypothetical protein
MNDSPHWSSLSRIRASALILVLAAAGLFLALRPCINALAQRRNPPRTAPAANPGVDYSKFSHATKKHQDKCDTCHKIPTNNWQKVRAFPDVADYPDHDTCVSCHRAQFFKGAKPVICSGCHTKTSPRDDDRFAFRKPDMARQFGIEFPHDKHQDVIARLGKPERFRVKAGTRSSLIASAHAVDDKAKNYNNCTICHVTRTNPLETPANGWEDNFAPKPPNFKASPVGHAFCFNCHWKAQPPLNTNCEGCHKLAEKPFVPDDVPKRISIKFRHDREQHVAECTVCHINITKAASLRGLKPDVPITSCTECHNKDGLRQDVSKELEALDKNKNFVCVYCHASTVGRMDAPPSHYLIASREPLKRKDLK